MKNQLFLLLLALIFALKGCQAPPAGNTPGDTPSVQETQGDASAICGVNDHKDAENNGYCDVCGEYVMVLLDFYSLNDLHGKFSDGNNHIGLDEMTAYLKAMTTDEEAFLLSAGDMWQGSAESNNTDGLILTDWMNRMDFAAMTLGNHEYDWGEEAIEKNAELAEFPFLAINIYEKKDNTLVDYCRPSVLVDRGKVQVGIIGAMGDCYSSISGDKTQDIYFITGSSLASLVKEEAQKLRQQGADLIVYVIHDGYEQNKYGGVSNVSTSSLSSYYDPSLSEGHVDLVFEGHTHKQYVLKDSHGVYHLQGGGDNKGLTHAEVSVNVANGSHEVKTAEFLPDDVYENFEDDPLIKELLNKYKSEIENALRIVGHNATYRNSTVLRNLVAKLYYEAGIHTWGDTYDITLGGGFISVRSPYELPAGDVSYATLQSIFPFDNDLVLCSIKGSDLIYRFINTSNQNYFVYLGGESKQEVVARIDPSATYYIITDTYCSTYAPNRLTEIERYETGVYARDLLAAYIEAGGMDS